MKPTVRAFVREGTQQPPPPRAQRVVPDPPPSAEYLGAFAGTHFALYGPYLICAPPRGGWQVYHANAVQYVNPAFPITNLAEPIEQWTWITQQVLARYPNWG